MKDIHILAPGPLMPMVLDQLAEKFTLHRLWEQKDKDAYLKSVAPQVRALAVGGHVKVDAAYFAHFPKLEMVSNFGVGYDSVDAKYAGQHKIMVTNTPDVLTEEVADTCGHSKPKQSLQLLRLTKS